jgi:hypothetical protein
MPFETLSRLFNFVNLVKQRETRTNKDHPVSVRLAQFERNPSTQIIGNHWRIRVRILPSIRTMTLGSTQPLTEMSIRNLTGGKERPARGADHLTATCESIVNKMWEPRRLTTLWAFTVCYRDSFIVYLSISICQVFSLSRKFHTRKIVKNS